MKRYWIVVALALALAAVAAEVLYPGAQFAKLDTFEGLNLEDADKLFGKRDYKGAYAAYKAYSFEFAQSAALPYVLLRMGRCLHLLDKRNAAIKSYQDVVDYFPDSVRYAAAAMFHQGECHGQNGDDAKKLAVWAKMVKDDDYVAEANSGTALTFLGKAMDKLGKFDEAVEYHWRTAVAFAKSNERAAQAARQAVIAHYTRHSPNHDKLKEFFIATNAFHDRHGKGGNPEGDRRYWLTALDQAAGSNKDQRDGASRYWVGKFGDLFADDDDLRIKLFALQRIYEQDTESWAARMNTQFAKTPATIRRVHTWVRHFNWDTEQELAFAMKHGGPLIANAKPNDRTLVMEGMHRNRDRFYAAHVHPTVGTLKPQEKVWLMNRLRHPLGLHDEAQMVLRSINTRGMTDKELAEIAKFAGYYLSEEDVLRYFAKMQDKLLATKARFDYYLSKSHRNRPMQEKALAEIPALKKSPDYAGQALSWTEADLLQHLGRYEEAIKAFRAANKQPDSTWRVTDCLVAMKNHGGAIKNVQGLESVKATASAACLRIADIHRSAGDKAREVDQLRIVLRRYPKSGQSSVAHERLESYGVALIGGEGKADE
ncbi:MAG: tetratricopeptide (TPR) repeat protein [Rhodothermales bacterium]